MRCNCFSPAKISISLHICANSLLPFSIFHLNRTFLHFLINSFLNFYPLLQLASSILNQSRIIIINKENYQESFLFLQMIQFTNAIPSTAINQQELKTNAENSHPEDPPISKLSQYCKKAKEFKTWFILELFTAAVYILIAVAIFYSYQKTTTISFHQQKYFSSEKVVYPSQIRGLFPPIQGLSSNLYGKWSVSYTNSMEISTNSIYNNFTIQFKANGNLRIKRRRCEGDLFMKWQIFQYNLFIREFNSSQIDEQMRILPEEEDIKCIRENSTFIENLVSTTVWSIYSGNLYLLVEKSEHMNNIQSIILLEPI